MLKEIGSLVGGWPLFAQHLCGLEFTHMRRFQVSAHPADCHRISAKLTMAPRNGLLVTARKRP